MAPGRAGDAHRGRTDGGPGGPRLTSPDRGPPPLSRYRIPGSAGMVNLVDLEGPPPALVGGATRWAPERRPLPLTRGSDEVNQVNHRTLSPCIGGVYRWLTSSRPRST